VLLGDKIECAAEAGGVAGGKQMLGRRGSGFARPAHGFGHRQVGANRAVAGFGVAVASAGRGCGSSKERFDGVHEVAPVGRLHEMSIRNQAAGI